MSTRSRIAIKNDDGSYTSVYCHSDGYPSHNGAILNEHYLDADKVRGLLALGDLSFLQPAVAPEPGVPHSFDKRVPGVTVAYDRDRGETNVSALQSASLDELLAYFNDSDQEYLYVFDPKANEEPWSLTDDAGQPLRPLSEELKANAA